jgi:hypothetical protein
MYTLNIFFHQKQQPINKTPDSRRASMRLRLAPGGSIPWGAIILDQLYYNNLLKLQKKQTEGQPRTARVALGLLEVKVDSTSRRRVKTIGPIGLAVVFGLAQVSLAQVNLPQIGIPQ